MQVAILNKQNTSYKGAVVSIGKFDGLHKGHQMLFNKSKELAKNLGVPFGAILINKPAQGGLLTPTYTKMRILTEQGLSFVLNIKFSDIQNLTCSDFVQSVIVNKLQASSVVLGSDFKFGKGALEGVDFMQNMSDIYGFNLSVIPRDNDFSSTKIKGYIAKGDMQMTRNMLGRNYCIEGIVIEGNKLARTLGFPTANIALSNYSIPKLGVYVAKVKISGKSQEFNAVVNIGKRPSIADNNNILLEAHILNFKDDIYGKVLSVSLIDFVREEVKFSSIDSLKSQITKDVNSIKNTINHKE